MKVGCIHICQIIRFQTVLSQTPSFSQRPGSGFVFDRRMFLSYGDGMIPEHLIWISGDSGTEDRATAVLKVSKKQTI
jgi:hypothetical protein